MTSQKIIFLRTNDYQESINTVFHSLKEDTTFTDVTLAAEDGQKVEAHKVILAASSPIFNNLLSSTKQTYPLIYMRGVTVEELSALKDLIYNGEANINQTNLDAFLILAKNFKLSGLNEDTKSDLQNDPQSFNSLYDIKHENTDKERKQLQSSYSFTGKTVSLNKGIIVSHPIIQADFSELKNKIKSKDKPFSCLVCEKRFFVQRKSEDTPETTYWNKTL